MATVVGRVHATATSELVFRERHETLTKCKDA